ncbi:MAG: response regulator transcription factor [Luteolibacter sp.]
MNRKTKIMLVEDNRAYRMGIACALEDQQDMELSSQFGTAEVALRELQSRSGRPDLVLLDLNLPGMTGMEALPLFREYHPDIKIIILTQSDRKNDILSCISMGADGYLMKSASTTQIREGIQTVMNGGASLDPLVARLMMETLQPKLPKPQEKCPLSEREIEILKLLSEGKVKKEISTELDISAFTVATHVRHIYEKFDVQNAPAAISKAYRIGILGAGD